MPKKDFDYLIGEALVGEGNEVAHIDLMIGRKNGPVGQAFAFGMVNMSVGHTPLLGVVRPNLPSKPYTLIIPKVTVKNMEQANKIFGPAQSGVAKAVADAVEEDIIPKEEVENLVIVCGVFIHPEADDYRRIFQYNYSATKLALKRALTGYPSLEKITYEKDRAVHPIMGFKVPRLWNPPYLQIALDVTEIDKVKRIIRKIPKSDRVLYEVGTPLLKKYGVNIIKEVRSVIGDGFIIADLKTTDAGQVEVDIAFDQTADAVVVSGITSKQTIDKFIHEARRLGVYSIMDLTDVTVPLEKLQSLKELPDIIVVHRGIDEEGVVKIRWDLIEKIKAAFKEKRLLIAVAGGIKPESAKEALDKGADIIIAGRYITKSRDVERACREFLQLLPEETDLFRYHVE